MGSVLEHHSLKEIGRIARENILKTYGDLAVAVGQTEVTDETHFFCCRGPRELPFASFAAGFDFDPHKWMPEVIARLKDLSMQRPGMYTFVLDGDRPGHLGDHLIAAGWQVRQRLAIMAWSPGSASLEPEITLAESADERAAIADFMAWQFFARATRNMRIAIADATRFSPCQLYSFGSPFDPDAAVMVSRTEESVGLYNLCVRKELRGKGIGSRVVASVQSLATRAGHPLILQCDPSLRGWYSRMGMMEIGLLRALQKTVASTDFA